MYAIRSYYAYYKKDEVVDSSIITYHLIEKAFVITSHQSILDENTGKVKAHIEMSRRLGDKYFKTLSEMLDIQLSLSLAGRTTASRRRSRCRCLV